MKLKNVLILAFLFLTVVPFIIVLVLFYQSGFRLSKESYTRNLMESINVQADYISQTLDNNLIYDNRFANRALEAALDGESSEEERKGSVLALFQTYLENSEDRISVSLLMDAKNQPIYTIGEKNTLDEAISQLRDLSKEPGQLIREFRFGGEESLGIVTPVHSSGGEYIGGLISIYNRSYIFKIISSYYEIADTATYLCRENGEVISSRGISDKGQQMAIEQGLRDFQFKTEGAIDFRISQLQVSGYYKNIHNSPWYLAGLIDDAQISAFTTQFIWIYLVLIAAILLAAALFSIKFSSRVVKPLNGLIQVIDGYPNSLQDSLLQKQEKQGYFEIRYLRTKFLRLMKTILLVQHNFEGVFKLYESSAMDDTNIDIDVKNQTIHSNKEAFEQFMKTVKVPDGACVVETLTRCFCEKDQALLMNLFERMRDEHLSTTQEAEVFTPFLGRKWFHTLIVPMYEDERLSRLFIQLRDITSFKKQEIESNEKAKHEALTGLYNRAGFVDCVNQAVLAGDSSALHGLLFLDMNNFKLVNDNFGHGEGDEVLRRIAASLSDTVGSAGFASRFGGDEFAVFLPGVTAEKLLEVKEDLENRLRYPYSCASSSFEVTASIGAVLWEHAAPEQLDVQMKLADDAMYRAKREYKARTGCVR